MEGNGQVNDIVYKCDLTRPLLKKVLDMQRENGRAFSIATSYHLIARDISIRQHVQVTSGT